MRANAIDYLAPARFDDLIEVFVRISRIGRTSVTYECAAYRVEDDLLLVTAHQTLVLVELATHTATPVPDRSARRSSPSRATTSRRDRVPRSSQPLQIGEFASCPSKGYRFCRRLHPPFEGFASSASQRYTWSDSAARAARRSRERARTSSRNRVSVGRHRADEARRRHAVDVLRERQASASTARS